jgi:hypothetical protein
MTNLDRIKYSLSPKNFDKARAHDGQPLTRPMPPGGWKSSKKDAKKLGRPLNEINNVKRKYLSNFLSNLSEGSKSLNAKDICDRVISTGRNGEPMKMLNEDNTTPSAEGSSTISR